MKNIPLTNLSNINRYSGTYLIKSESVSDHVWGMVSIALTYLPNINKNKASKGLKEIDLKELIYKINIHDIDEAFYTDIPRPFKWYDAGIHDQIERVSQCLMQENLSLELIEDINSAKDNSLEGIWVTILDFVQSGCKMMHEINLGNRYIKSELPNVVECLNNLRDKFCELNHIGYIYEIEFIDNWVNQLVNYE